MPMSSTKLSTDRKPPLSESLRTETLSDQDYAKTVHRLHALRNQLSAKPKGIKLAEKVFIITGVGSLKGIGRASAFAFAHEGSKHLYLLDLVEENLDELKTTMNRLYPETKVTTSQGDAADGQTVAKLCKQAIDEEGRLDGFFANAGIGEKQFFMDISSKEFMEVMRINLLSCFLAVKYGSEAMMKTSASKPDTMGSIILTASIAGIGATGTGTMHYSASKAGVNSLAKTAAYQLNNTNIRVNTICPGLVETGMTAAGFELAKAKGVLHKIEGTVPLHRHAVPEEIAQIAVFLASDDSSYVNGQNIAVDGGLSAGHPGAGPQKF